MKIGIDCRLWRESGVGRYTRNLVWNLAQIDKENEYMLFVRRKDYEEVKFQISNFKFQIIQCDIRWHTIEEQLKFPRILQRENLDLVHFPYFSVPVFYDKPFVVTIHDLILHHFPTGQASTLPLPIYQFKLSGYKFIIARAAQRAAKIITVSESVKKEIVDHLMVDPRKVIVTYEGVDEKFSKHVRYTSISDIRQYFLYVGNAYPHKNLERLLEAFHMLITTNYNELATNIRSKFGSIRNNSHLKLVFVGKEDYFYKRLKQRVKEMQLESSVLFLDYVSDEELASLYQNALALIAPSLMEGFDLPTVEAMANNCLVLASDIDVHHEICQDSAIYFGPRNTSDLAEKMEMVFLKRLKFKEHLQKGLEQAKMFSWETMTQQTLRIYESCFGLRSSQ